MTDLSADDLEALLGAYALDAVSDDERVQVERYLERSPRARAEVAELRETAAFLAHAGTDAPPGLWDRISGALGSEQSGAEPPPSPVTVLRPAPSRRPGWAGRMAAATGVAAAAIAIAVLAVQVVHQDDRLEHLEAGSTGPGVLAAADSARRDPDARRVVLESGDGALAAEVVYLPDGAGYLLEDNLDRLPGGRTYQLWALVPGDDGPRAISAGVLGPDPGVTPFRFEGPVTGFQVTEEDAPGVESSRMPAVVAGEVPV
jgi:anti-sigma-K factor RskA